MPPEARGAPLAEVTRAYQFSAAHRMHNPASAPRERAPLWPLQPPPATATPTAWRSRCGAISPDTGWVLRAEELDALVASTSRPLRPGEPGSAHPPGGRVTSTTEVLAGVLWRLLDGALPAGLLWRLRIEETPNNFFEVNRPLLQRAADPPDRPGPRADTESEPPMMEPLVRDLLKELGEDPYRKGCRRRRNGGRGPGLLTSATPGRWTRS